MATIHIGAGDYTQGIQKRTLGKRNIGFYCDCGEFVAFAVTDPKVMDVSLAADGPIQFSCPFCHAHQQRMVNEIHSLILTEGNKRNRTS